MQFRVVDSKLLRWIVLAYTSAFFWCRSFLAGYRASRSTNTSVPMDQTTTSTEEVCIQCQIIRVSASSCVLLKLSKSISALMHNTLEATAKPPAVMTHF